MSLFDVPEVVLDARPPGAKDFDFLQGRWLIHHKKLAERLVGCDTWSEFETPAANQLILGGLGNIDHVRIESGGFYEGASLRLFDKASELWRIYWMDTNGATLFPPVEGSFTGAVGVFRGHDQHNGIPVLVEFRWDKTNPENPTWQQSFSADNGNTWEVNWYMNFSKRPAPIMSGDRFILTNRSMAPGPVIPELPYADVLIAARWLCDAFGFTERLRIGSHRVQLHVGAGAVVVVEAEGDVGGGRVMVPVDDVDAHYAHARAAGAKGLGEPTTYSFGERQYSVIDIGGHRWTFTQTVADSDPTTWGGELVNP